MRAPTVALATLLLAARAFAEGDPSAEIQALHQKWFDAFDKGDGATMDRMEEPNLILVLPDGKIWPKTEPRAGKQRPTGMASRKLSKVQVRQFGDIAILTAILTSTASDGSKGDESTTVLWVRRGGQWRVASAQWTPVTKE